jgi:hypothetical protein
LLFALTAGQSAVRIRVQFEVIMLAYIFVAFAIAIRFLPFLGPLNVVPHGWNFTPLAASLLFFGARGSRRQMWVPFVLLAATDVVLTRYIYHYPLMWDQFVTWAWYAAILWLGTSLRVKAGFWRVLGVAAASSVSFFLISNFAVWASSPEMYPDRTFSGLMTCFAAGIPFYRNTAISDLFFSVAMFQVPVVFRAVSERMNRPGDHTAAA